MDKTLVLAFGKSGAKVRQILRGFRKWENLLRKYMKKWEQEGKEVVWWCASPVINDAIWEPLKTKIRCEKRKN